MVSKYCSLFKGMHIQKTRGYFAAVAQGNFISLYDLQAKKWDSHIRFQDSIEIFFKSKPHEGNVVRLGIVTSKKDVYFVDTNNKKLEYTKEDAIYNCFQ